MGVDNWTQNGLIIKRSTVQHQKDKYGSNYPVYTTMINIINIMNHGFNLLKYVYLKIYIL